LSVPVLVTFFGVYWCAARAVGAAVTWWDMCAVMPVVTVASSLPVSFSGLGIREGVFGVLLGDLPGVGHTLAISLSLAGFAIYALWSLIGAAFCGAALPGLLRGTWKKAVRAGDSR
jgi:hypothetical protein